MSYTSSQAQAGRGTQIAIGPAVTNPPVASPTYVNIEEAKTASIQGGKWSTTDVTNFNSGNYEEFITTIFQTGTVPLAGNRVSSDPGQAALLAALGTGKLYMFQITLPMAGAQTAGDVYTFNALVEGNDVSLEVEKAIEFSCSLKISGPATLAVGA